MSSLPELQIGDGLVQNSVAAVFLIDNVPPAKPGSLTISYKADKGYQFASIFLGTVPKLKPFDMDKMALKAGWANTNHIIQAMQRAGFTSVDAAKVTQALLDMEEEP